MYLMILGTFPGFHDTIDLPWPFWGLFKQLPYIYNLYLKFEPTWLGIWHKIVGQLLHARLVHIPAVIRIPVKDGTQ